MFGGSLGGVLGLDSVSESEVSSVGACDVVGCKKWSSALRRELGKAVKKGADGSVECFWVLCVRVSLCPCESVSV